MKALILKINTEPKLNILFTNIVETLSLISVELDMGSYRRCTEEMEMPLPLVCFAHSFVAETGPLEPMAVFPRFSSCNQNRSVHYISSGS